MSRNNRNQGFENGAGSLSRKVKQGVVEVDFDDSALVVHYETETVSAQSLLFAYSLFGYCWFFCSLTGGVG
jgi:hypothetical protein